MDELILNLLKENGRVILPDFGALLVKQKNPFTVIFNEFLQYNDGALIGAVTTQMNVDRDTATQKVKDLIKGYQEKLNKGEKIILKEIGLLTKSSTGKISLISSEENIQVTSKSATPVSASKEEKGKTIEFDLEPEVTKEQKPVVKEPDKKPVEKPIEKPIEKPVEKLPVTEKKTVQATTAQTSTKKTEPVVPKPKEYVAKKTDINSTLKPPVKTTTTPDYYTEPSKNKKNIFLWILLIVIVNGAIIGYFLYGDQIKQYIQNKKAPAKAESVITEETITPDQASHDTAVIQPQPSEEVSVEEPQEAPVEPEAIETQQTQQTQQIQQPKQTVEHFAGTKYYVVAGVFREEANADKLVSELKNKGYNAEKFGKIGNMYAVSYNVFQTKQEADKFMLQIKGKIDNEAWIKVVD